MSDDEILFGKGIENPFGEFFIVKSYLMNLSFIMIYLIILNILKRYLKKIKV